MSITKSSPCYRKFSSSNDSISSFMQSLSITTLVQRQNDTSASNPYLGVSFLKDKRRDFQDVLLISTDILDMTRRESRRSMMRNFGTTADLLDSTRRGMGKSIGEVIKRNVDRLRTVGSTKKDYPDDDQSFLCVGDKETSHDFQDEQALDENPKEVEEPQNSPGYQAKKSNLWIFIAMATRRGESR